MSCVRSLVLMAAGVLTVFPLVGCGPKLFPVKGVVTYNGKPLANASVQFISQEPDGKDARASTNSDGVFELSTFRPKDGAFPGSYKVTVHYSEPVDVPPMKSAGDAQKAMVKASASKKASIVLLPIYSQPDQTILKHQVPDDGDVKLELKSAPPLK